MPGAEADPKLSSVDKGLVAYLTLHGCHESLWSPQMSLEI